MKHPLLVSIALAILLVSSNSLEATEPPRSNQLAQSKVDRRPNILYFYVDDMGWGSIGPNGQAARKAKNLPYVRTPNLNRLARQGVNFTRGYGCHVCSPARSSQQSGFHQGHTFADRNDPNNAKKAMRADDILMGDALAAAGYTTGYWGKWGYGGSKDKQNPVIENIQTLPTSHGYQHVLAELHHVRAHTFFQPTLWRAPIATKKEGGLELVPNSLKRYQNDKRYPELPAYQNHKNYPTTAYCDDTYCFAALDFVRQQGQNYHRTGKPFFGLLAVQIPHAPFGEIESLPEWNKAYEGDLQFKNLSKQAQQWAAMVTRIDAHFGNILSALEDPNGDGDHSDSIAENTLVIFQSDNGGPGGKSNVEFDANGGLSGVKGRIQEGGIRVPLIMRWPAQINSSSKLAAGSNCDRIVDVTDLLPTFCDLANAPIPLGIDGVSIAPTLLGKGIQRQRDFIIHEAGNGQSIIRGKYKLVRSRRSKPKLYDLEADKAESTDIAADHSAMVKELNQLLLGERVDEPKGFANTYHHWTGEDRGTISEPDNWTDYRYSNAGVTYMEETGAPALAWVASIENKGSKSRTAIADQDAEFLGLEVCGNTEEDAGQVLQVNKQVVLTGRNEIRVGPLGELNLAGGTAGTLRWIDVMEGGKLSGYGTVQGTIYNQGVVSVGSQQLHIDGAFCQSAKGKLELVIGKNKTMLSVSQKANLQGTLELSFAKDLSLKSGEKLVVLKASSIDGRFESLIDKDSEKGKPRFRVNYTDKTVSISIE